MKVYVIPADEHGCGHYRLIWPAQALRDQGYDVEIVMPAKRDDFMTGVLEGDKLVDLTVPGDADIIVFQRVTHSYITQAIPLIREKGVAVVIDMDDDLTCIDPRNPAYAMLHPASRSTDVERAHSWHNALDACRDATMVTVSTEPLLRRFAAHGRGFQFDNYVPASLLSQDRQDSAVVGWAGSLHSHPGDLQTMGSSVNRLMQEGVRFKVIGSVAGIHNAWGVPKEREIIATGPTSVHEWPLAVGTLGVGVAPLADTKFNRAKSWLKALEYAATGVPYVAADMPEYNRLRALGAGLRASKPGDWYKHLHTLTESPWRRAEWSARNREVAARLTVEANAWKLWEGWTEALRIQRAMPLGAWSRR